MVLSFRGAGLAMRTAVTEGALHAISMLTGCMLAVQLYFERRG